MKEIISKDQETSSLCLQIREAFPKQQTKESQEEFSTTQAAKHPTATQHHFEKWSNFSRLHSVISSSFSSFYYGDFHFLPNKGNNNNTTNDKDLSIRPRYSEENTRERD
jgi:hypothetical protein